MIALSFFWRSFGSSKDFNATVIRLSAAVCSHGWSPAMRFSQPTISSAMLESQPDVVEAFEQAHAVGGRNVERDIGSAGAADASALADRR